MAPLDHIALEGGTLRFHIVREDNGVGFDDYGPFDNVATAAIAKHEMHVSVRASYDLSLRPVEVDTANQRGAPSFRSFSTTAFISA